MCLLAAAFLLTLQQDWGGKMPHITRPQVHRIVYELLPHKRWTPPSCSPGTIAPRTEMPQPKAAMPDGAPGYVQVI